MSTDWSAVAREIEEVTRQGGEAGVAVIAPDGAVVDWNGSGLFRAASTIKIAIMLEIYRLIERRELSSDVQVILTDELRTAGSGVLLHLHAGLRLTIDDLLYLMMAISDNTATNLLIDIATLDGINATLAELGLEQTRIRRRMLGRTPGPDEPENWIAPVEMARLLHAIVTDRAASPASCGAMRDLLRKQQNDRRISRFLPEGTDWGSKTGSLPAVTNDVGFITTPGGPLTLSIFIRGLDDPDGELAIGKIAEAALRSIAN